MNILSLNPGSSSLKFALFENGGQGDTPSLVKGAISRLGRPDASLSVAWRDGQKEESAAGAGSLAEAVAHALELCSAADAVGCRVVHGGPAFDGPVRVGDQELAAIEALAPLAPLHNPADVTAIKAVRSARPNLPVYAVFDTAFHRTLPDEAALYALPKELASKHHIRRYGFHGISYRYITELLAPKYGRIIACHLGNGASVCAIRDGRSIDTSMGFTPLEGLIMGTRSGSLDPSLVLYLQRQAGMSVDEVEDLLNHKSGLLGLSGVSADVQELEASHSSALTAFAYRAAQYIGAYYVSLGGLDALVFTGGIGEHSASMRSMICERLTCLGIVLTHSENSGYRQINAPSSIPVWVVPAEEERQIAREISRR